MKHNLKTGLEPNEVRKARALRECSAELRGDLREATAGNRLQVDLIQAQVRKTARLLNDLVVKR
ncbi:MAG: hypothetical protein PGN26_11565 [Xylophilus ampelinus]